jgi:hypothetical protein
MTRLPCNRTWQVEATLDGRLAPADCGSLDRHIASCEDCRAEAAAQGALRDAMASLPSHPRTDLEHRRARQSLLRAADARLVGAGPPRRAAWSVVGAITLAAGAALATALSAGVSRPPPAQVQVQAPKPAPLFEIADLDSANFTQDTAGETTLVTLRSGTAGFHVEHLEGRGSARFLVALPDGRLEVRGTRFVVHVEGGRTRSVTVQEGTVDLAIEGFAGLLHAGDRWPPAEGAPPAAGTPPTAAPRGSLLPPGTASGADANPADPRARPRAAPAGRASAPAAVVVLTASSQPGTPGGPGGPGEPGPPAALAPPLPSGTSARPASSQASQRAPAAPAAGARFAEAMGAFSGGDYGRADALFVAFVRDFPRDGRAEDAMFLRADARARRGDAGGAAAAAREYLRAFPRGLRRPEAERLAGAR